MPAALVHMGVQGALLRSSRWRTEILWIYVGAILPDIGWIIQRVFRYMPIQVDPFLLLSYSSILTTLTGCLIASAAIAMLTAEKQRVFALLATGSLLHLILDAAEIKWANGVLLFAPFSWTMTTWDVFHQDGPFILTVTAGSLLFVLWNWNAGIREINRAMWRLSPKNIAFAVFFLALFFAWPIPWLDAPEKSGLYDMAVIRDVDSRTGSPIEIDRAHYDSARNQIRIFTAEQIYLENFSAPADTLVSVRGVFQTPDVIQVKEYIIHHPWQRAVASKVGLGLLALFLMHTAWKLYNNPPRPTEPS